MRSVGPHRIANPLRGLVNHGQERRHGNCQQAVAVGGELLRPGAVHLDEAAGHWVATREIHQLVGEPVARDELVLRRSCIVRVHKEADPAHVVVTEERWQLVDFGVGVGIPVVVPEEGAQLAGGRALRREIARSVLEREIEYGLHRVAGGEARRPREVEDLAKHEELLLALALRVREHLRAELLPELVVDVLHGVDPEAVDAEISDPGLVDVDHPVHDGGVLGEQIVESEAVAVVGVLADECRVAAVVVERDVVEPAGNLEVLLVGIEPWSVWE